MASNNMHRRLAESRIPAGKPLTSTEPAIQDNVRGDDDASLTAGPPLLITIPDAERLLLQSRFVKNRLQAELLQDLEIAIRRAKLLDPASVPPDLVTMNSSVLLRQVDGGRRKIARLVFPSCGERLRGIISVLSPLGSILLGARAGRKFTCPLPWGIATMVVDSILHQPEAAGDFYG